MHLDLDHVFTSEGMRSFKVQSKTFVDLRLVWMKNVVELPEMSVARLDLGHVHWLININSLGHFQSFRCSVTADSYYLGNLILIILVLLQLLIFQSQ